MPLVRVFEKFSIINNNGEVKNLQLQDCSQEYLEHVLDLFMDYFIKEETFLKTSGIYRNKEAVAEARDLYKQLFTHPKTNIMLCCIDSDKKLKVVAASVAVTVTKNMEAEWFTGMMKMIKTIESRMLFQMVNKIDEQIFSAWDYFKVDTLNIGRGIVVHPDYRGHGIATKFIQWRPSTCKADGVTVSGAWMTAIGTQKATQKAGWKACYEISFDELGQRVGVTFDTTTPMCKWMFTKIQQEL